MSINAHSVIQGIIRATDADHGKDESTIHKPVVTISRVMGSVGNEIGSELAKRLGVELYGHEVLDAVAKSAHVDEELMSKLHERAARSAESWIYALVFGKNVTRDDYVHRLVSTVRGLYWKGGVIMGRGGHVILAGRDVLRVRIVGSIDVCARRIADQEGIDIGAAKKRVRESNRKRGQFEWDMFHCRLNDPTTFDLVINTDALPGPGAAVDMIMVAVQAMGLDKRAAAHK